MRELQWELSAITMPQDIRMRKRRRGRTWSTRRRWRRRVRRRAKTKTKKEAKETKAPKEDDDAWKLEKSMYNKLKKLFEQQTEGVDTLAPPLAIKCFKKSGVPEETVKTVTKMVLKGHKGPVELGQFVVIMYMLKMIKEGASAPTTLPASLKKFL